jgi:hypothetical protein
MKTLIKLLPIGATVFLVAYLLGAFAFADLNISHWPIAGRAFVALAGGMCAFSIMGATWEIMDKE